MHPLDRGTNRERLSLLRRQLVRLDDELVVDKDWTDSCVSRQFADAYVASKFVDFILNVGK